MAQAVGGKPIEVRLADAARIGETHTITRRWAKRGTRPVSPKDQRIPPRPRSSARSAPTLGKVAGLVMPRCTTEAMGPLLAEIIAQAIAPARAVLRRDQAGRHPIKTPAVPANLTLLPLPARAHELNPVENLWQLIRNNLLGHRSFNSDADILDHCCDAWNTLIDRP